jgi:hypothetical protein
VLTIAKAPFSAAHRRKKIAILLGFGRYKIETILKICLLGYDRKLQNVSEEPAASIFSVLW